MSDFQFAVDAAGASSYRDDRLEERIEQLENLVIQLAFDSGKTRWWVSQRLPHLRKDKRIDILWKESK